MTDTVTVEIQVEPEAAKVLQDYEQRRLVGQLVSRMLRPAANNDPLSAVIARIKGKAHAAGLTDAAVDAELAAAKAARRGKQRRR
jgi:hypothetical protein